MLGHKGGAKPHEFQNTVHENNFDFTDTKKTLVFMRN